MKLRKYPNFTEFKSFEDFCGFSRILTSFYILTILVWILNKEDNLDKKLNNEKFSTSSSSFKKLLNRNPDELNS